jgi:hypothetical protein
MTLTSSSFASVVGDEIGARDIMDGYGWPKPLQDAFLTNLTSTAMRYFICDDSGSMVIDDGSKLVKLDRDRYK